ncbi:hypothetical protein CEXT_391271 [Caerostris extrusa]|uniref:RNase H type-1 domain-containing protein n=1 Tax=Caerostris extrusa TaxID=172846 RepID=A0AAV4P0A7_CAEEX|nr:hypothetical protein CEXT_391271 [Caerostris extrusa]
MDVKDTFLITDLDTIISPHCGIKGNEITDWLAKKEEDILSKDLKERETGENNSKAPFRGSLSVTEKELL